MGSHSGGADDDVRVPASQVLVGRELHPLESNSTAIEAFGLIKLLDGDGDVPRAYRTTDRLNREELLGALTVQVDVLRKELSGEWGDDE